MVEPEERLDEALRAARAQERDQGRRRRWAVGSAASYALDTLFLALYVQADALGAAIPAAYGAGAALIFGFQYLAYARGWNLRARDPNLTEPFILLAIAMNLGVVAAAPQITFPFLANQFTVFAFGMLWLSLRDSIMVWTLGALALGAVLAAVEGRMGMPVATRYQTFLTWAYFALIMGRCLVLSVQASDLRQRLADSRRRLAESLEQVRKLASHDELTGVLNRRALISALERERSRAERSAAPFGIAMIDLDHFKDVNDSYGHAVGDEVLKAFAAAVRDTMRVTDVFGRYGGEEFLLILVGTEPAAALEAMERIREAVAARDWRALTPGRTVTISAGIANFRKGDSVEQLLHRADAGLYQAKAAGRNRTIASEP